MNITTPLISASAYLAPLPEATPSQPQIIALGDWNLISFGETSLILDLGGDHTLLLDRQASGVILTNQQAGVSTAITGELAIDLTNDGEADAQFWGGITFKLTDATKITVQTRSLPSIENTWQLHRIVVTNKEQGLVINGFDAQGAQDLSFEFSENGRKTDNRFLDNFVVNESADGTTWLRRGQQLTEEILRITAPGEYYGSERNQMSLQQLFASIMQSLSILSLFSMHSHIMNAPTDNIRSQNESSDRDAASARRQAIEAAQIRHAIELSQLMTNQLTLALRSGALP